MDFRHFETGLVFTWDGLFSFWESVARPEVGAPSFVTSCKTLNEFLCGLKTAFDQKIISRNEEKNQMCKFFSLWVFFSDLSF